LCNCIFCHKNCFQDMIPRNRFLFLGQTVYKNPTNNSEWASYECSLNNILHSVLVFIEVVHLKFLIFIFQKNCDNSVSDIAFNRRVQCCVWKISTNQFVWVVA
jgi:hypothetical protein